MQSGKEHRLFPAHTGRPASRCYSCAERRITMTKDLLLKPLGIVAFAAILVVVCGYVDYITGPDYSLAIIYFIPVFLAAWFGSRWAGVVISFFAAAGWLLAELYGKKVHEYPVVLYWNDFMELLSFLFVSYIISALKNSLEQQKLSARIDHLTGIPNRRHFYDLANLELNVSRRYGHPVTVMYLDIDNFKTVNDTQGHSAGDLLLRQVSGTIKEHIRKADVVARLGGDEFALLLPETGSEAARAVVDKVWGNLKVIVQSDWPVTFSIGMITYLTPPATVDELIRRADEVMYDVKRQGKNMLYHQVVGEE